MPVPRNGLMKMIEEHLKGSSKGPGRKNQAFVSPGLGCRENLEPCVLQNPEWSEGSGWNGFVGQLFFCSLIRRCCFVDLVFKLIVEII